MLLRDLVTTSWQNLWVHRLRAILSILGIVIGIGSFSIMQSVGEGAKQETIRTMKELGADILTLTPNFDPSALTENASRSIIDDIQKKLEGSAAISAISGKIYEDEEFEVPRKDEVFNYQITGVTNNFHKMFKLEPARGRWLTEFDFESRNLVCVIGRGIAAELFPGEDPINKKMAIKNYLFNIVGVLREPSRMVMALGDIESQIFIPLSVAQRIFKLNSKPMFYALATDTDRAMLMLRHFFITNYDNGNFFIIRSQKNLIEAQEKNVKVFQYVLWTIGSISLLVGGIGIMNIMLVSVTERLREIGIRRAIGAKRLEILFQFLAESLLLCIIGAGGGVVLGYFGSTLTNRWTNFMPVFSFKLLAVSLAIAAFIGIVFGTYPAFRAAKLDPSRALRYD
jgi:putative ABC transport system permease protein